MTNFCSENSENSAWQIRFYLLYWKCQSKVQQLKRVYLKILYILKRLLLLLVFWQNFNREAFFYLYLVGCSCNQIIEVVYSRLIVPLDGQLNEIKRGCKQDRTKCGFKSSNRNLSRTFGELLTWLPGCLNARNEWQCRMDTPEMLLIKRWLPGNRIVAGE